METVFPLVFALVIMLVFAVGSGWIADRKGRSFTGWAVAGLFLGIFGILLAAVMPKKVA